jgi:hypothetical protein
MSLNRSSRIAPMIDRVGWKAAFTLAAEDDGTFG